MVYITPCRICGGPTKYRTKSLEGRISCNNPKCISASRLIRGERIRQTALRRYASGERRPAGRWHRTAVISPVELLIKDKLLATGWTDQHKLPPGVRGIHAPRTYHLDFALVEKKLCVEIDGSSHRKEKQRLRDERRDRYLAEIGWRTLRFTNEEVLADPSDILAKIASFAAGNPVVVDPPQLCAWCHEPMLRSRHKTCSKKCRQALHDEAIRGKPTGRKGLKLPSRGLSYIPCRICGKPTRFNGTPAHPRWGTKACDNPDCQAKSKLITRQNQSKALKGNQKLIEGTKAAWDRREGNERLWPKNRPEKSDNDT